MTGTVFFWLVFEPPVIEIMESSTPWNKFSNEIGISTSDMEQAGQRFNSVLVPFILCCIWTVAWFFLHFSHNTCIPHYENHRSCVRHILGSENIYQNSFNVFSSEQSSAGAKIEFLFAPWYSNNKLTALFRLLNIIFLPDYMVFILTIVLSDRR